MRNLVVGFYTLLLLFTVAVRAEISSAEFFEFQRSNSYEAVVRRLVSQPEGESDVDFQKFIDRGDFPVSLFPVKPGVRQFEILSGKKKLFQLVIDKPAQRDRLYDVTITPTDATGLRFHVSRQPRLNEQGQPIVFPTTTAAQLIKSISENGGTKWIVAYTQPGVFTPVYSSAVRNSEEFKGAVLYNYVYFNQGDATHKTINAERDLGKISNIGTLNASGGCSRLPADGAAVIRKAVEKSGTETFGGFQATRYSVIETLDTLACEDAAHNKYNLYLTPDRTLARLTEVINGIESPFFSATDGFSSWLVTGKSGVRYGGSPTVENSTRKIILTNRAAFDWTAWDKYKADNDAYKAAVAQRANAASPEQLAANLPAKPQYPAHTYQRLLLVDTNPSTPKVFGTSYRGTLTEETMVVKETNQGSGRNPKIVVAGSTVDGKSKTVLEVTCTNASLMKQREEEARVEAEERAKAAAAKAEAKAKARRSQSSPKKRR